MTKPKEHPILFSNETVRAILDGRKTQTRRPLKPQPETYMGETGLQFEMPGWHGSLGVEKFAAHSSPFGVPGDTLWVRECWAVYVDEVDPTGKTLLYRADMSAFWDMRPYSHRKLEAEFNPLTDAIPPYRPKWTPSIHMPRWASRIDLEVTAVRAERIQDISEADARAEGVDAIPSAPAALTHRTSFARLWDAIYAKRGFDWDSNPWVWVGCWPEFSQCPQP